MDQTCGAVFQPMIAPYFLTVSERRHRSLCTVDDRWPSFACVRSTSDAAELGSGQPDQFPSAGKMLVFDNHIVYPPVYWFSKSIVSIRMPAFIPAPIMHSRFVFFAAFAPHHKGTTATCNAPTALSPTATESTAIAAAPSFASDRNIHVFSQQ